VNVGVVCVAVRRQNAPAIRKFFSYKLFHEPAGFNGFNLTVKRKHGTHMILTYAATPVFSMRFFNHSHFRIGDSVSTALLYVCAAQILQIIEIYINAGTRPRYINHVRCGGFLVWFGNVLGDHKRSITRSRAFLNARFAAAVSLSDGGGSPVNLLLCCACANWSNRTPAFLI
jgi:hypothetical protein